MDLMEMETYAGSIQTWIEERDGVLHIGDYPVYEAANRLPLTPPEEFDELCISIREHGLQNPILLSSDDEVVDGRNRLLACLIMGIEPEFEHCADTEPDDVIITHNLHRRNHTPSQRAILMASFRNGEFDPEELAKEAGVSERMAYYAKKVVLNGHESLQQAVMRGETKLATAASIASKDMQEQEDIVGDFGKESADKRTTSNSPVTAGTIDRRATKEEKPFVFGKWRDSVEKTISRAMAKAPEDQRDRCMNSVGEMLSVNVRRSSDDDAFGTGFVEKNSETIVDLVDELIEAMPKTEQRKARTVLSEEYGEESQPVSPKKAPEALEALAALFEGLSKAEQKKFQAGISDAITVGTAKQYLPTLPNDAEAALNATKGELMQRLTDVKGFKEIDETVALKFYEAVVGAAHKFAKSHGLDVKKKFIPPTVEAVASYCSSRNNGIDAEKFHSYYAAQGWKLANGKKMEDWEASVRRWENSSGDQKKSGTAHGEYDPDDSDGFYSE